MVGIKCKLANIRCGLLLIENDFMIQQLILKFCKRRSLSLVVKVKTVTKVLNIGLRPLMM
jgi:competence transcription factor ComK